MDLPQITKHAAPYKFFRTTWFRGLLLIGIFASASLTWHFIGRKANGEQESKHDRARAVMTEAVSTVELRKTFTTQAALLAKQEVVLRPPNQVTVREVRVSWGQRVRKGDVLAVFESEAQDIRKEMEKIDLQSKTSEFQVTEALARKKFVSGKEFEQKKLELRSHRLRQRLTELESARLIKSPIDGVVAEVQMKPGDFIDQQSTAQIRVIDPSLFRSVVFLPQKIATQISKGQQAIFKVGGQEFPAQVSAVSPVVDSKTGSVLTEVVALESNAKWVVGMQIEIQFVLAQRPETLAISAQAVLYQDEKPFVYRVIASEDESVAQKVPLELGLNTGSQVEVLSGLEEFDEIVVQGQTQLSEGSTVLVKE